MRLQFIGVKTTCSILVLVTSACSEGKDSRFTIDPSTSKSIARRDLLDLRSGPAVKIYPLEPFFDERKVAGAIRGKRPESAPTGLTAGTEIVAAVTDCVSLPILVHGQLPHSERFVTFSSFMAESNESRTQYLSIVSCIQDRSRHDFVASIIGPRPDSVDNTDVPLEWELGEVPGDIRPFRSLHAKKN